MFVSTRRKMRITTNNFLKDKFCGMFKKRCELSLNEIKIAALTEAQERLQTVVAQQGNALAKLEKELERETVQKESEYRRLAKTDPEGFVRSFEAFGRTVLTKKAAIKRQRARLTREKKRHQEMVDEIAKLQEYRMQVQTNDVYNDVSEIDGFEGIEDLIDSGDTTVREPGENESKYDLEMKRRDYADETEEAESGDDDQLVDVMRMLRSRFEGSKNKESSAATVNVHDLDDLTVAMDPMSIKQASIYQEEEPKFF